MADGLALADLSQIDVGYGNQRLLGMDWGYPEGGAPKDQNKQRAEALHRIQCRTGTDPAVRPLERD